MAKLSAKSRDALATSSFAGPDRTYPINDISHARLALAMVSKYGSSKEKSQVRRRVCEKYPSLCKKND